MGRSGFWRRTHDLAGTDWELLLPLPRDIALHLHDAGMLSIDGDAASTTLHPGVMVLRDSLEARLALSRPESMMARVAMPVLDMSDETTPGPLADLWASSRPA